MKLRVRLSLLATISYTSSINALDFNDSYKMLLDQNAEYQAQVSRFKASKSNVWAARSSLLPQVSLVGSYGQTDDRREESARASELDSIEQSGGINSFGIPIEDDFRNADATLSIEQTLFDPAKWYVSKESSSQSKESYYQLLLLREDLILQLVQSYTSYLDSRERKSITSRELKALAKHKTLTLKRHRDGLGTATDVSEAESRYQLVYADFLQTSFEVNRSLGDLDVLLTERLDSPDGLSPEFTIKELMEPSISGVEFMETNDTLLADQQVESAKFRVKQSTSKFLPSIKLAGRSRYFDQTESVFERESEQISNSIMLELEMPIFAGFGNASARRGAKHELNASKYVAQNSKLRAQSDFEIGKAQFVTSYNRLKALEAAYSASEGALNLREKGYLEGLSSNLDLLDALRDTYRAERLYTTAVYEYFRQYYQFIATHREITDSDILFFNKFLAKEE